MCLGRRSHLATAGLSASSGLGAGGGKRRDAARPRGADAPGQRRLGADTARRRVTYSPWQGGIHSHIVTGERDESLPLRWFRYTLRLTVRRQVPAVVAI